MFYRQKEVLCGCSVLGKGPGGCDEVSEVGKLG